MIAKLARIEWLPQSRGGRVAPPVGPRYVAPAKFLSDAANWPHEAWSLVVDLIDRPHRPDEWLASVHFLVDDAPHHLIADGAGFELYEGRRCVAHGHVRSPAEVVRAAVPDGSIPVAEAARGSVQ